MPIGIGIDGWYLGVNLFFGQGLGWLVVDPLTGAMWTLAEDVHVNLTQLPTSSSEGEPQSERGVHVLALEDVPPDMLSHLIPIKSE